ncbi:MAG: hypothetical protein KA297_00445 [Kofleriaceae bacterium]|nr:hypothetical protein [Kofleriaceae bacterium]
MEIDTVQPWHLDEELIVVCPPTMSTGWLLDAEGRPGQAVNLSFGSRVVVRGLQVGSWTDVVVSEGRHAGARVRLASNEFLSRV